MNRWFAFRRDLGVQLFALYLLLIIPFLITLLIFDGLIGVRIREDVQISDLSLAQSISQETNLALTRALDAVEGLSAYSGVVEANDAEMDEIFSVIFNTTPEVNLVYRLDSDGTMLFHYPVGGPTSTVGNDFSFRDYFQLALTTDQPLVSKGRISPTTNQAVATAVMPLWSDDGQFLGLIGANIRLESLSKALTAILAQHQAEDGLQVVILDSDNQIIAHPDSQFLLQPATAIIPENRINSFLTDDHSQIFTDLTGEERLHTHTSVPDVNWQVIVSRPTSAAFATQIILRRIVIVAAGTFILRVILLGNPYHTSDPSNRTVRTDQRIDRAKSADQSRRPESSDIRIQT